eukprot:1144255-Pelagomonas_calceolata.AAC.3
MESACTRTQSASHPPSAGQPGTPQTHVPSGPQRQSARARWGGTGAFLPPVLLLIFSDTPRLIHAAGSLHCCSPLAICCSCKIAAAAAAHLGAGGTGHQGLAHVADIEGGGRLDVVPVLAGEGVLGLLLACGSHAGQEWSSSPCMQANNMLLQQPGEQHKHTQNERCGSPPFFPLEMRLFLPTAMVVVSPRRPAQTTPGGEVQNSAATTLLILAGLRLKTNA